MNYFDSKAATWDSNPKNAARTAHTAEVLRAHLPLGGDSRVLDYGCGSGELALALLPYVGYVKGVDTSKGMIERFKEKIKERGLTRVEAELVEAGAALEGGFDLIICNMVLHHIPDPLLYVRQFESSLAAGGFLAIIDLDKEDGSFHPPATPGVFHRGFSREEIGAWLAYSYLTERYHDPALHLIHKNERTYPITLTLAQKSL